MQNNKDSHFTQITQLFHLKIQLILPFERLKNVQSMNRLHSNLNIPDAQQRFEEKKMLRNRDQFLSR